MATFQLRDGDRSTLLQYVLTSSLKANKDFLQYAAYGLLQKAVDEGTGDPSRHSAQRSIQSIVNLEVDPSHQRLFSQLINNCQSGRTSDMLQRWRAAVRQWQQNPTRRINRDELGLLDSLPQPANAPIARKLSNLFGLRPSNSHGSPSSGRVTSKPLKLDVATILHVVRDRPLRHCEASTISLVVALQAANFTYCVDNQFHVCQRVANWEKQHNELQSQLHNITPNATHALQKETLRVTVLSLLNQLVQNLLFDDEASEALLVCLHFWQNVVFAR